MFNTDVMKDAGDYFYDEEIDPLMEHASNERNELLFFTLLMSGRRIGEIIGNPRTYSQGLCRSDLFAKDCLINFTILKKKPLPQAMRGNHTQSELWEMRRKMEPIKAVKEVNSVLMERLVEYAKTIRQERLFPITEQRADQILKKACVSAGLTRRQVVGKSYHLHMFRHTFAIRWIRADTSMMSLLKLSKYMEHSNIQQTMTYVRYIISESKEVLERL